MLNDSIMLYIRDEPERKEKKKGENQLNQQRILPDNTTIQS